MRPEEINRIIAEYCGWRRVGNPPNYYGDLNAMHEAEKALSLSERVDYMNTLGKICGTEKEKPFATAAQRAEAFVRIIGKWVDVKEEA